MKQLHMNYLKGKTRCPDEANQNVLQAASLKTAHFQDIRQQKNDVQAERLMILPRNPGRPRSGRSRGSVQHTSGVCAARVLPFARRLR